MHETAREEIFLFAIRILYPLLCVSTTTISIVSKLNFFLSSDTFLGPWHWQADLSHESAEFVRVFWQISRAFRGALHTVSSRFSLLQVGAPIFLPSRDLATHLDTLIALWLPSMYRLYCSLIRVLPKSIASSPEQYK